VLAACVLQTVLLANPFRVFSDQCSVFSKEKQDTDKKFLFLPENWKPKTDNQKTKI